MLSIVELDVLALPLSRFKWKYRRWHHRLTTPSRRGTGRDIYVTINGTIDGVNDCHSKISWAGLTQTNLERRRERGSRVEKKCLADNNKITSFIISNMMGLGHATEFIKSRCNVVLLIIFLSVCASRIKSGTIQIALLNSRILRSLFAYGFP